MYLFVKYLVHAKKQSEPDEANGGKVLKRVSRPTFSYGQGTSQPARIGYTGVAFLCLSFRNGHGM